MQNKQAAAKTRQQSSTMIVNDIMPERGRSLASIVEDIIIKMASESTNSQQ
jgi:hypothetical protein